MSVRNLGEDEIMQIMKAMSSDADGDDLDTHILMLAKAIAQIWRGLTPPQMAALTKAGALLISKRQQ
jgi:hypothetical protein